MDMNVLGLDHLCLQLGGRSEVDAAFRALRELGVDVSEPRLHPEYDPDYYASFFEDPDGLRLELVGRRQGRDYVRDHWDEFSVFLNPVAEHRARRQSAEVEVEAE
jgi:hypothetical protein